MQPLTHKKETQMTEQEYKNQLQTDFQKKYEALKHDREIDAKHYANEIEELKQRLGNGVVYEHAFVKEIARNLFGDKHESILWAIYGAPEYCGINTIRYNGELFYQVKSNGALNIPDGRDLLKDIANLFVHTYLKVYGDPKKHGMKLSEAFRIYMDTVCKGLAEDGF